MPPIVTKIELQKIGNPEVKQTFAYIDRQAAQVFGLTWEAFDWGGVGVNFRNYEGGEPDYRLWTLTDADRQAAEEEGIAAATAGKTARLVHEQAELTNAWGDFAQQTGASMHELFPSVFSAES